MIVRPDVVWADPNADLQTAIDATPAYGTLYLPAATYTASTAAGWIITKPITIQGHGNPYVWKGGVFDATDWDTATVLRPHNAAGTSDGAMNSTVLTLRPAAGEILSHVVLKDFGIENPYNTPVADRPNVVAGTGDGICFDASAAGSQIAHSRIENVTIEFMGRDCLHLDGGTSLGGVDQCTFSRVDVVGGRRHGIWMKRCTDTAWDNVLSVGSEHCGWFIDGCMSTHLFHCLFNGNGRCFKNTHVLTWDGTTYGDWPHYNQAQLFLNGCQRTTITGCDFEVWSGEFVAAVWTPFPVQTAIGLYNCHAGTITACTTYNADYVHGAVESWFIALLASVSGFMIAGNHLSGCDFGVLGLLNLGVRGNTVLMNAATTYETTGNDAPCAIQMQSGVETDSATPSGGNFVLMPMKSASLLDSSTVGPEWCAGVQLPTTSAVSAITSTLQGGTVAVEAADKALKLYQDGAWQTVAAGLVSIDGDIVTHNDDPVSY